jgi:hypothetical protein
VKSCTCSAFWPNGAGSRSWRIHDAVLVEGPADEIEDLSLALDRAMRDAAALVLRGYELPTDCQLIRPGERYFDERGEAMWKTVTRLVAKLERETA